MSKPLTEDQVERSVERQMDHIDKCFLEGHMDQQAYDCAVFDIDCWAEGQYKLLQASKAQAYPI